MIPAVANESSRRVSCARSSTYLWVVEARPLPALTRALPSHLVIWPLIRRLPSELGADIDTGMCRRRLDMTGRCMKRRAGGEDVSQRRATRIIDGVWPQAGRDDAAHATILHRWVTG